MTCRKSKEVGEEAGEPRAHCDEVIAAMSGPSGGGGRLLMNGRGQRVMGGTATPTGSGGTRVGHVPLLMEERGSGGTLYGDERCGDGDPDGRYLANGSGGSEGDQNTTEAARGLALAGDLAQLPPGLHDACRERLDDGARAVAQDYAGTHGLRTLAAVGVPRG